MNHANNQTILRDYQTTITILEHLSEAIFILMPDGKIQYANGVACDLLGAEISEILNKSLNDFLEPPFQFKEDEKTFLEQIYQNGILELESTLKNGKYVTPVVIGFGFVRNLQDEVNYIIASARDISQRKNLEKELYQQQLYTQSRDRFRELGELAINIVHRLSQPITSVQLLIEMMRKKTRSGRIEPEQFEKNFRQIEDLLRQMNEVISNVRNFAFLTEDEKLKPVDIWDSIQMAIQHLHYEITENNVEVFINKDKELPRVFADPMNIQQTFTTLLRFFLTLPPTVNNHLKIDLLNADHRWVEVAIYNTEKKISKMPGHKSLEQHFNLTVVQLMVISGGGDFNHFNPTENEHIFVLRFPVANSDDRQQLLNMIDLMHQ